MILNYEFETKAISRKKVISESLKSVSNSEKKNVSEEESKSKPEYLIML